jgi:hypothetical protein
MVVNETGRAVIYAPAEDQILHRRNYDRMAFSDLRQLYMNRQIEVGQDRRGNPILGSVAGVRLRHTERRQFIRGVTFDPSGRTTPEGILNLWQGFAIQPRGGSWERLRIHVRDIICCGNREHYQYLILWLARLVQRPAEQGEVAIVMRAAEGTGKGTLARAMKRILGQHSLAISNSKHLTGNFNAHLRDCVFLFADEAFFAGDRQHVGVLKSIITEPYLTIEGKYQNAMQTPNFLHLMMASNVGSIQQLGGDFLLPLAEQVLEAEARSIDVSAVQHIEPPRLVGANAQFLLLLQSARDRHAPNVESR